MMEFEGLRLSFIGHLLYIPGFVLNTLIIAVGEKEMALG